MNLNRSSSRSHSVCRLFTVVLLGLLPSGSGAHSGLFRPDLSARDASFFSSGLPDSDKRNSAEQQPVYRFLLHICQISPA